MQLPPVGLPVGAPHTGPTRAAAGYDPQSAIFERLTLSSPPTVGIDLNAIYSQPSPYVAAPPQPPVPGPVGAMLARIHESGYVFSLKDDQQTLTPQALVDRVEAGDFASLQVQKASPPVTDITARLLPDVLSPIPSAKMNVFGLSDLQLLDDLAQGDLTGKSERLQTLAALEKAGCQLLRSGKDFIPGQGDGLMHRKSVVIDGKSFTLGRSVQDEPPKLVGSFGAADAGPEELWVRVPGAQKPGKMRSLDEGRFFVLHEDVPHLAANPRAAQLRELEALGVQFGSPVVRGGLMARAETGTFGALGAFHHAGALELSIGGISLGTYGRGQDGTVKLSQDFHDALRYFQQPEAEPGLVRALAVPTGLSLEQKIETYQRLKADGLGTGAPQSSLVGKETTVVDAMRGLLQTQDVPFPALVNRYLEIRAQGAFDPQWALDAARFTAQQPHLQDRLVQLGRLGDPRFESALDAEVLLRSQDMPYEQAFQVLQGLTVPGPDKLRKSVELFPKFMGRRHAELEVVEDARLTGKLVKMFGPAEGMKLRETLRGLPGSQGEKVDVLLREYRLSGDAQGALLCLQPGGNPAVPEPLETRELAAKIVDKRGFEADLSFSGGDSGMLNAFYDPQNQTVNFNATWTVPGIQAYKYLLGLPDRQLVQDAGLYHRLIPRYDITTGRAILSEYKEGRFGKLTPDDLCERLTTLSILLGDDAKEVVETLRQGVPDYEQRKALCDQLRVRFQEPAPTYRALRTELPPSTSLEDGIASLERLHQALDSMLKPNEVRDTYVALVDSVRAGAWQGQSLAEATDRYLQAMTLRGPHDARKALTIPPADGGFVTSGIRADNAGVTIGGVRLRTRT